MKERKKQNPSRREDEGKGGATRKTVRENHGTDRVPQPGRGKRDRTEGPVAQQPLHHAYTKSHQIARPGLQTD